MVDFSAIPGGDKQLDHPTAQQGNVNSGGAKAFGVHRSAFTVHRSPFTVRRSAFGGVRRSSSFCFFIVDESY
jgi:hypothetical protein